MRRALEALLDLGRHMLAKGFGQAPSEYKEVAAALTRLELLDPVQGALLTELAGYRNRLVYFYDEITARELYDVCSADWRRARPRLRRRATEPSRGSVPR